MARLPRVVVHGCPHHVIQRGNNRQVDIFLRRNTSIISVGWGADIKHGCTIHAYVLMTNYVHLLVTADGANSFGMMMQTLGRAMCTIRTGSAVEAAP